MPESERGTPSSPVLSRPIVDPDECKGCQRCVVACPKGVLRVRPGLNRRGVRPVEYTGAGCTGCVMCFYTCPEPYAIRVERPDRGVRVPQRSPAAETGEVPTGQR
jgi:NAD-dependent dihydropyrimidine dehydrogenase PreA subunit